jgi:hypothetical protein
VHAQIGGKLAQIGSRLVDGAARKMADEFFTAFAATVEANAGGTTPAAGIAAPEPAGEALMAPAAVPPIDDANSGGSKGLPPALWIGALVLIVAAIVWWAIG